MKKNNKGFSLVELIIVIAIMAILVGIMAPQLMKYIEKAKVSSDQQLLDAIYDAIVYAYVDPDVISNPDSQDVLLALTDSSNPLRLEDIYINHQSSAFCSEVLSTLGWDDLEQTTYEAMLQSKHDGMNAHIYIYYQGDFDNPVVMWISTTDASGGKDVTHFPTSISDATLEDIEFCIHID